MQLQSSLDATCEIMIRDKIGIIKNIKCHLHEVHAPEQRQESGNDIAAAANRFDIQVKKYTTNGKRNVKWEGKWQ